MVEKIVYRIRGVLLSVLASYVVDRGFEPRSGQTTDSKILIFVASLLIMQHLRVKTKTGWLGIQIVCPSGRSDMFTHTLLF